MTHDKEPDFLPTVIKTAAEVFISLSEDFFFIMDSKGKIVEENQSFIQVFGKLSYHHDLQLINFLIEDHQSEFRDCLTDFSNDLMSQRQLDLCFRVSASEKLWLSLRMVKKQELIFCVGRDISNFKEKDKEVAKLLQAEQQLSEELTAQNEELERSIQMAEEARETIRLKEQRISSIYNQTPALLIATDMNGVIMEVSDYFLTHLKIDKTQLIGHSYVELVSDRYKKAVLDQLLHQNSNSHHTLEVALGINERNIPMVLSIATERQKRKNIGFLIVHTDISERIKAEQKLSDYKNNLEAIINANRDLVLMIDGSHKIVTFNRAANTYFRRLQAKDMKVGDWISDYMPTSEHDFFDHCFESAIRKNKSLHFVREIALNEKSKRWYTIHFYPVKGADHNAPSVVLSIKDVTFVKRGEERFKELALNYSSIINQMSVGVMLYTLDFDIIRANDRFYEMLGYSEEEYRQMLTWESTHEADREKSRAMAMSLIKGEIDRYQIEKRYITKSGEPLWVLLNVAMIKNDEGEGTHLISVIQDISAQKLMEKELLYRTKELDTFVYRASHDLKGPIASITGIQQVMGMEFKENEAVMNYLNHQQKNAEKLNKILNSLLDLVTVKDRPITLRKINLKQFFTAISEEYDRPDVVSFDLTGCSSLHILTDEGTLYSIAQNLIENGIKYAKENQLAEIKISTHKKKDQIKISIADNGRGIHPNDQDRVFDMFYRACDVQQGTGLGLYIVKNAVDRLSGSILLNSYPGRGTEFVITLPAS
ncbi:MAG: PAS domain S-box protein [Cyclobacteriaceae bacterium]|nr:PAS domain S-box protein [Cyclobacteriaceae bacterium]MCH8516850.1 PAS domain S-box protein [Cyclobacteriaceae bacterium]